MKKTPIAVFTYNRPAHTHQMLQSLASCARLDECDIFIYSDGPRLAEHAPKVAEVRSLLRAWSTEHPAQIIEREENWGLMRSIIGGVTELCEQYGRAIVVEDDLLLHPAFVRYMISALDRYENEERVAQISGYMFPVQHPRMPDAFFLPFSTSWGWATWNRVWKNVDWQAANALDELRQLNIRRRFDLDGAYPFATMLINRLQGKNQAWAILFYWYVFTKELLVLHPRITLVMNAGHEGSGFHTRTAVSGFNPENFEFPEMHFDGTRFPQDIAVDEEAYRRIKAYLARLTRPRLLRRLSLHLKKKIL